MFMFSISEEFSDESFCPKFTLTKYTGTLTAPGSFLENESNHSKRCDVSKDGTYQVV